MYSSVLVSNLLLDQLFTVSFYAVFIFCIILLFRFLYFFRSYVHIPFNYLFLPSLLVSSHSVDNVAKLRGPLFVL